MNNSTRRPQRSRGTPDVARLTQQLAALRLQQRTLTGYVCKNTPRQIPNFSETKKITYTQRGVVWDEAALSINVLQSAQITAKLLKIRKITVWGGQDWTTIKATYTANSSAPIEDSWVATDVGTRTTCPCVSIVPAQDDWLIVSRIGTLTVLRNGLTPATTPFTTPYTVDVTFDVIVESPIIVRGTPPA